MRAWIAVVTFVAGAVLWYVARRDRVVVPLWLPRLGLGITALGLSTMALTLHGLAWNIVSIAFSVAAIALIASVLRDILRRR